MENCEWVFSNIKTLIKGLLLLIGFTIILSLSIVFTLRKQNTLDFKESENIINNLPFYGVHQLVSSFTEICSGVGADILRKGGNAIDSVVATAFCQDTTSNFASSIGGGGVLTITFPNGTFKCVDFREVAPYNSSTYMFVGSENEQAKGVRSIAIPGNVKGYEYAWKKYGSGKISWKDIIAPSINPAKNGFKVYKNLESRIKAQFPTGTKEWKDIFAPNNAPLGEGELVIQANLANTLDLIAKEGSDTFYYGTLANQIVDEIKSFGGNWTNADLIDYEIKERDPVVGNFRGYKIVTTPLPFGGVSVIQILNILEKFNLNNYNEATVFKIIESLRFAFGYRLYLGDPDFIDLKNIVDEILSKETAATLANKVTEKTHNYTYYLPGSPRQSRDDHGTDHVSVIDSNGIGASLTHTVNYLYGSGLVGPKTGIVYNDEMDDFSTNTSYNIFGLAPNPQNFIKPRKRPLSSMSPTICLDNNNNVVLIAGGSGGPTILTGVAQVIYQVLNFGKNIRDAIEAPRVHHQNLPETLFLENSFTSVLKDLVPQLQNRGYNTYLVPMLANINGIKVEGDIKSGWGDTRKLGVADGD